MWIYETMDSAKKLWKNVYESTADVWESLWKGWTKTLAWTWDLIDNLLWKAVWWALEVWNYVSWKPNEHIYDQFKRWLLSDENYEKINNFLDKQNNVKSAGWETEKWKIAMDWVTEPIWWMLVPIPIDKVVKWTKVWKQVLNKADDIYNWVKSFVTKAWTKWDDVSKITSKVWSNADDYLKAYWNPWVKLEKEIVDATNTLSKATKWTEEYTKAEAIVKNWIEKMPTESKKKLFDFIKNHKKLVWWVSTIWALYTLWAMQDKWNDSTKNNEDISISTKSNETDLKSASDNIIKWEEYKWRKFIKNNDWSISFISMDWTWRDKKFNNIDEAKKDIDELWVNYKWDEKFQESQKQVEDMFSKIPQDKVNDAFKKIKVISKEDKTKLAQELWIQNYSWTPYEDIAMLHSLLVLSKKQ